ncbi:glycosyltransferase family 4 protein [Novosphingobium sp. 1949]|uniref:Glycosyltransferase family 4 protein n=1 Tax=Novosphingobium organovorum TaxID=2930092 RepID=A0ABT0BER7_9SPHN|nr:glycosyltransferase family 1 protein [Novosphingobium organovorum]MCJ2183521.1 glycosyltransferase family 4 protein [Novosphingobium organovorum]
MRGLDINGKFLDAPLNGVHRTAAEFSEQLIQRALHRVPTRLLSPRISPARPEFPHLRPRIAAGALGPGQGWEMGTLPWLARGNLLMNFCNLAPLLHGNSLVMIHDAQTFLYPQDYSGRQAAAYRRLLPWIGQRARRVLTVSEFARQCLIRFRIAPAERVHVVHNGTDHLLKEPADPHVLARLGLTDGGYVLALGSAKGYKNMRAVFDALRDPLPSGHRLVVAGGPGPDTYRAKGWEPPAHALFTGFVSDSELRALYTGASVFLFPSLTEGFGLPPVEAMHCATPVVAAQAGAMPEVCADAAILVPPQDPAAYRAATCALLEDEALHARMTTAGQTRAAQLTWKAAGQRLWDVVQPLL